MRVDRVACATALLCVGCGGAATPAPTRAASRSSVAPAVSVAAVPLRRLTREEYNNAVRDLLGDTSRPADAFPVDEAVSGFESNNLAPVTPLVVERYMDAAETVAATAAKRTGVIAPCSSAESKSTCASNFIEHFGRLAFRRPLDDGERSLLLSVYQNKEKRSSYEGGIQLVIQLVLQSPQFLYRVEAAEGPGSLTRKLDGYELATRLSFFIWASTPDKELLDAAAAGRLDGPAEIEAAARRMLADPRAVAGIRSFHRQWLGLRELDTASKEGPLAAAFTPELKDAMVEETLRFSTHAVMSGGDAVKTLLTSNRTFVNGLLAKHYGVAPPAGDGFALVSLPEKERSGVLTQASVMTVLASADQTSPIQRGKFVRERLLCQPIAPPPPNVAIAIPKLDPKLTTKQRFAQHRSDPSCASCHALMDPIGFGFEHYDAIGAFRSVDGQLPVDAVGELSMTDDADGPFDGAVELGARLAASKEVRHCIAVQWFCYALGRSERDEDSASVDEAYRAFEHAGFDVRELIVAITGSTAFRYAHTEQKGTP